MYGFSEKGKKNSQNLSHFENESTFRKRATFLKMKAHFEKGPHFENESLTMLKIRLLFNVNEMNFMDLEF